MLCIFLLYKTSHYFWKRVVSEVKRGVSEKLTSKTLPGVSDNDPVINGLRSRIESLEGYLKEHDKVPHNVEASTTQNIEKIVSEKIEPLEVKMDDLGKSYEIINNWAKEWESKLTRGELFAGKEIKPPEEKRLDTEEQLKAQKALKEFLKDRGDSARNILVWLENLNSSSNENDKVNFINSLFDLMDSDDQKEMESIINHFGKTVLQVNILYITPGKSYDAYYEMVREIESSYYESNWKDKANKYRNKRGLDIKENEVIYVIKPTIKSLNGGSIQRGRVIVYEKPPS